MYPFTFNKFIIVSSQTLLLSPETSRSLLIANDPNSCLNLHISRKIILPSLSDTFFGQPLLNLCLSATCVESTDLTARRDTDLFLNILGKTLIILYL